MTSFLNREALDRLGVAAALACGVHCVLAPLAIGALTLAPAHWFFSTAGEATILAVTALLGLASLVPAYLNQHRSKSCLGLFLLGLGTLIAAKVALHGDALEPWLLGAGAAMIASAHLANVHFCRRCTHCSDHADAD